MKKVALDMTKSLDLIHLELLILHFSFTNKK